MVSKKIEGALAKQMDSYLDKMTEKEMALYLRLLIQEQKRRKRKKKK